MPLPATRKPLHNVGAARRKGSRVIARSNAKIYCPIRSRQFARRTTCDAILFQIRCNHVRRLPEKTAPTSAPETAACFDSGQCSLSPRHNPATIPCRKASHPVALLSSTVQPRAESSRKSLEACKKTVYSQSILSTAQRSDCSRDVPAGVVEQTEHIVTPFMRHYLSRCV